LKKEFLALVEQYDLANGGLSVTQRKHPAFVTLVALGPPVIPLILLSIMEEPRVWLTLALRELVEDGPTVKDKDIGVLDKVTEAWLRWGEIKGHIPTPNEMVDEISDRLMDLSDEQVRAMYVAMRRPKQD
jgi:hypothetical protein